MSSKVFKKELLQVLDFFLFAGPQVLKLEADWSVVKRYDPSFGSRK